MTRPLLLLLVTLIAGCSGEPVYDNTNQRRFHVLTADTPDTLTVCARGMRSNNGDAREVEFYDLMRVPNGEDFTKQVAVFYNVTAAWEVEPCD